MGCKILAVGDVCLKDDVESELVDETVGNIMKEHNVVTCDIGIALRYDDMKPIQKVGPYEEQSVCCISRCKAAGISMGRLAGNHIMDYGIRGIEYLMKYLNKYGIDYVGAAQVFRQAYKPLIKELDGMKIAFFSAGQMEFGCACEEGESGFAWVNSYELEKNILQIRKHADYVFVFVHAGIEDTMVPMYEWRERYRTLIHLGCDFVIATHPHIIQGIEEYENGLIAYSLGNFAYDRVPACRDDEWNTSIMLSLELEKGTQYKYQIYPVKYTEGVVCLNKTDEDFKKRFSYANKILLDEAFYQRELNRICITLFDKYYYAYYTRNAVRDGIIDPAFLFHNIGIESHNYLCRRALQIKMKTEEVKEERFISNPYENKYLLWGVGNIGRKMSQYCQKRHLNIIGITDSNQTMWGNEVAKIKVLPLPYVKELLKKDKEIIGVICTDRYYSEVRYVLAEEYGCKCCIPWDQCIAKLSIWDVENMEEA